MNVGVDLVSVSRLAAVVERTPAVLGRLFTSAEVADCLRGDITPTSAVAGQRFAARFAAKEAARKALGVRLGWRQVEVRTGPGGAPSLWVEGRPAGAAVSLAHDRDLAIAFVVAGGG